jgi:hypothetical protein
MTGFRAATVSTAATDFFDNPPFDRATAGCGDSRPSQLRLHSDRNEKMSLTVVGAVSRPMAAREKRFRAPYQTASRMAPGATWTSSSFPEAPFLDRKESWRDRGRIHRRSGTSGVGQAGARAGARSPPASCPIGMCPIQRPFCPGRSTTSPRENGCAESFALSTVRIVALPVVIVRASNRLPFAPRKAK